MPLLTNYVGLLNPQIFDGVGRGHLGYFVDNEEFIEQENKRGIQLIKYAPIKGGTKLFPDYFNDRRLNKAFYELSYSKTLKGDVIGSFIAAWDDHGLHNETSWLGWATGAQYSLDPWYPFCAAERGPNLGLFRREPARDGPLDTYRQNPGVTNYSCYRHLCAGLLTSILF